MLYKYLSVGSLSFKSILENQEVYFSPPSKLNDPFEIMRNYTFPDEDEIKRHLVGRGAKPKNLERLMPGAIETLRSNHKLLIRESESIAERAGIFCLTPHASNLLMWAHYGDSHRGVCIGFDIERPFDPDFGHGYEVEYSDIYPNVSVLELDLMMAARLYGQKKLPCYDDVVTKSLYTKSTHWRYENEIRYVRTLLLGTGVGSMGFPAGKVKEIILGARASNETYELVEAYHKKYFAHAKLMRLEVSGSRYELDYLKSEPEY